MNPEPKTVFIQSPVPGTYMKNDPLTVNILKPIHGTYVSISANKLREAIQNGQDLLIRIPQGEALVDPKDWIRNADKVEKRVMKYKNNPLTLYYGYVPIPSYAIKNKNLAVNQIELFT